MVIILQMAFSNAFSCIKIVVFDWKFTGMQCLKLMVAQSPLATKNWAGPVKFDPGQVKIITDYIRKEIFLTFLGD